jgi:hypothetical protein
MWGPNWAFYSDTTNGYLGVDAHGNIQNVVDNGASSLSGPSADTPLWTSATLSSSTAGYVQYVEYSGPSTFTVYPGVLTQVTATENTTAYGSTEGTLSWLDVPAANTNAVNDGYGLEGLLTIESTTTNNKGGSGVDGEVYVSGAVAGNFVAGVTGYAEQETSATNGGYLWGGQLGTEALGGSISDGESGIYDYAYNGGATITNGFDGIQVWTGIWGGSVTGDMDGIYIEPDIWGGTVDNRYGIFIAAGDGAPTGSDYGIYQESTTASNYFGGAVQLAGGVTGALCIIDAGNINHSAFSIGTSVSTGNYLQMYVDSGSGATAHINTNYWSADGPLQLGTYTTHRPQ